MRRVSEVVRAWYGDSGTRYRYVVYETDTGYQNAVQKGEDGRYVDDYVPDPRDGE